MHIDPPWTKATAPTLYRCGHIKIVTMRGPVASRIARHRHNGQIDCPSCRINGQTMALDGQEPIVNAHCAYVGAEGGRC